MLLLRTPDKWFRFASMLPRPVPAKFPLRFWVGVDLHLSRYPLANEGPPPRWDFSWGPLLSVYSWVNRKAKSVQKGQLKAARATHPCAVHVGATAPARDAEIDYSPAILDTWLFHASIDRGDSHRGRLRQCGRPNQISRISPAGTYPAENPILSHYALGVW